MSKTFDSLLSSDDTSYLVVGFEDFENALSRPQNDTYYRECKMNIQRVNSHNGPGFLELITHTLRSFLADSGDRPCDIHIDYSCMPRLWYCHLPLVVEAMLREFDQAYFWYTMGTYPVTEYPTAGVGDFHIFSGKPSLGSSFRTHLFGLGFDKIRSQATWSIIDPQNLICFYADPATRPEYVERVKSDNKIVISNSNHVFTVPIDDFVLAYSKIASVASEFGALGDVILIPDGPKPLILAASLVPFRILKRGITCLHIARHKTKDFEPVDVEPLGEPIGFRFAGLPKTMTSRDVSFNCSLTSST